MSAMLDAALAAAGRGWPVFPVRPGDKRPTGHDASRCPGTGYCTGGHRTWEQRATTDPALIRACWTTGTYNIGVACGPAGLLVLDLDVPDPASPEPMSAEFAAAGSVTGADVLAVLADQAGQPEPASGYRVATPSGGEHRFFRAPAGRRLRCTRGGTGRGLGPLIDTRGGGGYVLAAGSTIGGRAYRLLDDGEVPELAGWLADRLDTAVDIPAGAALSGPPVLRTHDLDGYAAAALEDQCRRVADEPSYHNDALYISAVILGQLVAGGSLPETTVRAALTAAFTPHIAAEPHRHSEREADKTITSGLRAGAKRPRRPAPRPAAGPAGRRWNGRAA